ncbi:MAG: transposase [Phycisphaerae bacterium]|nr:transposase [Phycisphaerae bacterium]
MKDFIGQASQKIAERLSWCTARRDQGSIAKNLADGKDIPEVYGLGEAGLFDEFFFFLDEFRISERFDLLDPKLTIRQSNVKFPAVILIYLMRIVAGLAFFWHTHPVLLRSQPLMQLVGFNGREVRKGTCARGLKKSPQADSEDKDGDGQKIRGPICPDSIAAYIQAISASALERFFNGVIRILAAQSFFPKRVHALLDATEIESTEQCEGCGKVTKEKAPSLRNRKRRIRKILETVFGFKLWLVWDPTSRLPIAIGFATIDVHDTQMAQEVVEQAIRNLGPHAKLVSLAFDRGFTDGTFLWWIHTQGITFYTPAKTDMHVYQDALSVVDGGIRQTRQRKRAVGRGKQRHTVLDHWEVVGIAGLTSAGFYGELGSGSHENRKDFVPNPINAVVVLDDPYKANNPNADTLVILTNDSIEKPLQPYDAYDIRSEMENAMFREAKQGWFIERPARNNADSYRAHVYLTIITMGLTQAFRSWMDSQDELESQGQETGIRKFREKVKQENGNKLIVFDEGRYAIFETYEVFILCGRNVLRPRGEPEKITKEDILRKYCVAME